MALYAYEARADDELSFEKGERLLVLKQEHEDWRLAMSLKSQEKGYIPNNYIVEEIDHDAQ